MPGGRVGAWAAAMLVGLIGVAMLVVGLGSPDRRVLGLTVGGFMLAVAWLLVSSAAVGASPSWRTTTVDSRPAWALPIRGSAPAATVLTVLGVGLAVGVASAGSVGVAVVVGPVALFCLVLGLELWRIWLRRPELRIGADLVQLRGPGIDTELAWEDVGAVDYADLGTRWASVHVSAALDAPSYRYRMRRLLLPLDRVPAPPGVAVRVGQVPDAPALLALLRALHTAGPSGRQAMIDRGPPTGDRH